MKLPVKLSPRMQDHLRYIGADYRQYEDPFFKPRTLTALKTRGLIDLYWYEEFEDYMYGTTESGSRWLACDRDTALICKSVIEARSKEIFDTAYEIAVSEKSEV